MREPRNEFETVIYFARNCDAEIIRFDGTFPDAIINWQGKQYRVEFEYRSSNFITHGHDPLYCDLIICWTNDIKTSLLPVIELSKPGWKDYTIELISDEVKMAAYWQQRAILAEREVKHLKLRLSRAFQKLPNELRTIDKISEQRIVDEDNEFKKLVNEGMSRRQASLKAYGRAYAGDIVDRGKMALGEK